MLSEERFTKILGFLQEKNTATVSELAEAIGTSESTIRRDLTVMDKRGLLRKVYGGAASIQSNYVTSNTVLDVKEIIYKNEKNRIARFAASLIEPGDFVFIDSGSTINALISAISVKSGRFVTNNIKGARALALKGNNVTVIGGRLNDVIQATVGIEAVESLKKYNFTKGFFGVNGIHAKRGISTPDIDDAMVKRETISRCRESYVLADPSKFGLISNAVICDLKDVTIITTRLEDSQWHRLAKIIEVDNENIDG